MSQFFDGWRRKVGCVTLVMALVMTDGWIRSFGFSDALHLPTIMIASDKGWISLYDQPLFYKVPSYEAHLFSIPYFYIALPLTLLSAYLLLTKHLKSISDKFSDPISVEGA